jgi:hypothetical protein
MSEVEFPRESEQDKIVKRLIKVAKKVASRAAIEDEELIAEIDQAIEDAELLFEDTSPRAMGWVGDNGLP